MYVSICGGELGVPNVLAYGFPKIYINLLPTHSTISTSPITGEKAFSIAEKRLDGAFIQLLNLPVIES
jgi:hypothetical protein